MRPPRRSAHSRPGDSDHDQAARPGVTFNEAPTGVPPQMRVFFCGSSSADGRYSTSVHRRQSRQGAGLVRHLGRTDDGGVQAAIVGDGEPNTQTSRRPQEWIKFT